MTEQQKAAAAYKAGAAQRDPQAVKSANATAAQNGSQAAGAERGPR
ncbi:MULTISPECIES: hypothetical protein [unclassified Streptomyces]|nr:MULTISPECIES: hypothetical protein [unclassified Streptomyces]MBT2453301.1 hypothetical protein [Streptomyces sp. ISL-86]